MVHHKAHLQCMQSLRLQSSVSSEKNSLIVFDLVSGKIYKRKVIWKNYNTLHRFHYFSCSHTATDHFYLSLLLPILGCPHHWLISLPVCHLYFEVTLNIISYHSESISLDLLRPWLHLSRYCQKLSRTYHETF